MNLMLREIREVMQGHTFGKGGAGTWIQFQLLNLNSLLLLIPSSHCLSKYAASWCEWGKGSHVKEHCLDFSPTTPRPKPYLLFALFSSGLEAFFTPAFFLDLQDTFHKFSLMGVGKLLRMLWDLWWSWVFKNTPNTWPESQQER